MNIFFAVCDHGRLLDEHVGYLLKIDAPMFEKTRSNTGLNAPDV